MTNETATIDEDPTNDDDAAAPGPGTNLPPPLPPPSAHHVPWWQVRVACDPVDKKIGGVIGGISHAYGFDVRTTRVAVAIATIVMPALLAVYLAAWILLPHTPAAAKPLRDVVLDRRRLPLVIVLIVVAIVAGVGSWGSWFVFGGFGWGLALVAVGVLLWAAPGLTRSNASSSQASSTNPSSAPAQAPPPPPTTSWASPSSFSSPVTTAAPIAEVPRRRRFPIASISFLVAVLVGVFAAAGDALNWWNASVLGVTLAMISIVLVGAMASAIVNRSWITVPLALVLVWVGGFLIVTTPNLNGGIGERRITPITVADTTASHELGIGLITLDLRQAPIGDDTLSTKVEVGIGQIDVIVPTDVELRLDTHVGAGVVLLDGEQLSAGLQHGDERTVAPLTPTAGAHGTLELDLQVGAGKIEIERSNS